MQPTEIELTYFDSTLYVVPDPAGQHAYAVLFQSPRDSGLVGVAQITGESGQGERRSRMMPNGIPG